MKMKFFKEVIDYKLDAISAFIYLPIMTRMSFYKHRQK